MTSDALNEKWFEHKSALMDASLGKGHDRMMHAVIPFSVGGDLDLYYYPNGIPGTAIATMEVSEVPYQGPKNNVFSCYELVMFTRQSMPPSMTLDENTPFGKIHGEIRTFLNYIARYSAQATLNPNETVEFPQEMEDVGGRCLVFAEYSCLSDSMIERFGLMAMIEIFRSEMEYARNHGGGKLIERLKKHGHYPYTDMNRKPVA